MKRSILWLLLLLAAATPAMAQRTTLAYITDADCDTEVCTSAAAPGCREGNTLYLCNVATGFYVPAASVGAADFAAILTGTNTAATMTVGNGASIVPSGTGTITATALTGSGSTTNAVDLATAEVAGTLAANRGGTGNSFYADNRCIISTGVSSLGYDTGCQFNDSTDVLTIGDDIITTAGDVTLSAAGALVDGKNLDLVAAHAQIVNICPSGCEYSTLSAACAAETSTAANPIIYHVHAGLYSGTTPVECSGEDYATIRGDGPSSFIDVTTVVGENGILEMGTSTNWTVEGMRIRGHRAIISQSGGASAGKVTIRNNDLETDGNAAAPDQDCGWFDNPGSGSEFFIQSNRCATAADGFTINSGGAGVQFIASGNDYRYIGTSTQSGYIYAFEGIPCYTSISDDYSYLVADRDDAGISFANFQGVETGCASGAVATIRGVRSYVSQTDATGTGNARGVVVQATATELAELNIIGSDFSTNIASASGSAVGVSVENATTVPTVISSKFRTSGGATPLDFNASTTFNGQFQLLGVDYTTTANVDDMTMIDQRRLRGSEWGSFGPVAATYPAAAYLNVLTAQNGTVGLLLDNTDEAADEQAPDLKICNSTAAASESCFVMTALANNRLYIGEPTGSLGLFLQPAGTMSISMGPVTISYPGAFGNLYLGDGTASDSNQINFNAGTTDATVLWDDTNNQLELQNVDRLKIGSGFNVGATCDVGDVGLDTTGAKEWCVCGTTNTWGCWNLADGTFDATGPAD